jgi:hypothetical protein
MWCFEYEFFAGVYLSTGTYQMQSCISGIRKTTRVDDVEVLIGGFGYEPSVNPWHHFFLTLIHGLDSMCCFKHEFFAGVYLSTGTYQMQSCISGIRKTTRVDDVEVLIGGFGYEPSVNPWQHFFLTLIHGLDSMCCFKHEFFAGQRNCYNSCMTPTLYASESKKRISFFIFS